MVILRILRLLPQFRAMERSLADTREQANRLGIQLSHAEDARKAAEVILKRSDAERDALKSKVASLEADIRRLHEDCLKLAQEKAEVIANAGDAVALRHMGRRMFSKAPIEAPPQAGNYEPINLSSGSRPFARDIANRKNREFFENALKQSAPKQVAD